MRMALERSGVRRVLLWTAAWSRSELAMWWHGSFPASLFCSQPSARRGKTRPWLCARTISRARYPPIKIELPGLGGRDRTVLLPKHVSGPLKNTRTNSNAITCPSSRPQNRPCTGRHKGGKEKRSVVEVESLHRDFHYGLLVLERALFRAQEYNG